MTTLYCHPNNDYTGSTRVLADILKSDSESTDLKVITTKNKCGLLSDIPGLKIINVPHPLYKGRFKPLKLLNLLSDFVYNLFFFFTALRYVRGVDKVYINTILPFGGVLAAKLCNKPIIYHIHEKIFIKWHMLFVRVAEMVFNKTSAKRIYVSEYTRNCYVRRDDCQEVVCYNRLPSDFINDVRVRPVEERPLNTIMMVTSLSRFKGVFTFIELAKRLSQYRFIMVVSADKASIDQYIGTNLPENLVVYPSQKTLSDFYFEADLVVNLSNPSFCIETFGLTIIEAMAFGIPVIAPNAGGPLEIIHDNVDGILTDVTDVEKVAIHITSILKDKQTYAMMSKNALKNVVRFM